MAKSGVLLVKQEDDRRAEPLHAFENEKARDAGDKDTDDDENQIGGRPKIDAVGKKQDVKPEKQRVDAEVGEQAAKIIDREDAAVDENHRHGEPKGAKKAKENGEHASPATLPCAGWSYKWRSVKGPSRKIMVMKFTFKRLTERRKGLVVGAIEDHSCPSREAK